MCGKPLLEGGVRAADVHYSGNTGKKEDARLRPAAKAGLALAEVHDVSMECGKISP